MRARALIASVGAGRMGRGIAQVFAYAGHPVHLLDIKQRSIPEFETLAGIARAEIHANLQALADAGLFSEHLIETILQRIQILPRGAAPAALADAEFVFECVPEVIATKRAAFAFIDPLLAGDAVLASTTSTILVDTLAQTLAAPERFLNAHWLNPAYLIPLVEISPGKASAETTLERTKTLLQSIGKVPVVCAASPGFIVPRIQALAMNEAARMVEQGVASAEDIDKAIRYGFGFRFAILGLLEFIDWGGGDILYYASQYLSQALHDKRFEAPEIVKQNMQQGRIGLRSGQGFYDFATMDVEHYREDRLSRFVALLNHIGAARAPVID